MQSSLLHPRYGTCPDHLCVRALGFLREPTLENEFHMFFVEETLGVVFVNLTKCGQQLGWMEFVGSIHVLFFP